MSANLIGAVAAVIWIGLGLGALFFVLTRTRLLDGAQMNFGLSASGVRRGFGALAAVALIGAAVIGWIGGPILFGDE